MLLSNNMCVKMDLPNSMVVDILSPVFNEMSKWLQDSLEKSESGGYIVGYQHEKSRNITLEMISHPYLLDAKSRVEFKIRDIRHKIFLKKAKKRKSYYMGVWHTHPQYVPIPSQTDWKDWYETLKVDKTACEYVFFIIAGISEVRIWTGDFQTGKIYELKESLKEGDLYKKVK